MLECLIGLGKISNEEKLIFIAASSEDESISLHYKKCLAASLLSQEDVQFFKDSILEGTESRTSVIRFHKWLITTTNDDLPWIYILSDDEKSQNTNKWKEANPGEITIQQVLVNYASISPIEQLNL